MHKNKIFKNWACKNGYTSKLSFACITFMFSHKLPSKQQCNTTVLTISDYVGKEVECGLNGSYESLLETAIQKLVGIAIISLLRCGTISFQLHHYNGWQDLLYELLGWKPQAFAGCPLEPRRASVGHLTVGSWMRLAHLGGKKIHIASKKAEKLVLELYFGSGISLLLWYFSPQKKGLRSSPHLRQGESYNSMHPIDRFCFGSRIMSNQETETM